MEEVRKGRGGRWEEGDKEIEQWKAIPGWLEKKEIQEVRAFKNLDLRGQKMLRILYVKKEKQIFLVNEFGCRQSLG